MEMVLGFAVLLVCLFLGIRHGGIGLAVIFGMTFDFLYGFTAGAHLWFLTRMPSPKITEKSRTPNPGITCRRPFGANNNRLTILIPYLFVRWNQQSG